MKFKGTIIITDPCYLIKEEQRNTPLSKDDWNDWDICDCGNRMEVLGINHYICNDTIYGDWSCNTYPHDNPIECVDKIAKITKHFQEKYTEIKDDPDFESKYEVLQDKYDKQIEDAGIGPTILGSFCADAGLVIVCYLDEVLAYNPDFDEWKAMHPWCVTTIPDFDGDVTYYKDKNGNAHIIGIGNINFFTKQADV